MPSTTTTPGYVNGNNQKVVRKTGLAGSDHNQVIYAMQCLHCNFRYGANGSDIEGRPRKCPNCQDGKPCSTPDCCGDCEACEAV